tara:strand:+ start:43 stop:570 length:528 start_codon:yes stop_codon:yes gene_type:complete
MYKIYRIVDNTNGNIYIGKTKQKYLSKRLGQHKTRMNCMSSKIIKNGDYKIELIEETDDETRERYWIENTECINKQIPGRTYDEWYRDNKEIISEKQKKYRKKNKENIKERDANYYKNNKQHIIDTSKKNRDKNKDRCKEQCNTRYHYRATWGGDERHNNNLLMIDPNLFLYDDF